MKIKLYTLLLTLILSTLISCNSDKNKTLTYFGGKVINPKSNHIVLFLNEKVIDTFFLNSNNKFIGNIKNVTEGLYYFVHGNENQHIYIKPKDSLMLRLNTWDFDESLVFAGEGAERNNMLIDCFLDNEREINLFYYYYRLKSDKFKAKVDSLIKIKTTTYNNYVNNHNDEANGYKEILKIALTYPIYSRIEKYPIMYAKYSEDGNFPVVDNSFYNFRKNVDLNKDFLINYPPYSHYVTNFLYNKTYSLGHLPMKSEYSSKFTIDLLNTIDKNITSESSKNAFLKQTVISHFYNKSNCDINTEVFNIFLKLSTNDDDKKLVENLVNDSKSIIVNEKLPNFEITDYLNIKHKISNIIKNKNTFIFFWSHEFVSDSYIVSRIRYLSNRYPNIKFIQVNIDGNPNDRILKLDIKNQYYLDKDSKAHEFLTSKMPRSILLNKDGKVVNGFASISSYNLEPYLKELNKN